jgi:hypothetical protein
MGAGASDRGPCECDPGRSPAWESGASSPLLVGLSERHLRLPATGVAWLIAAVGVGALLGPSIPNAFAHDNRDARWMFVPYVIRGIGDVLIAAITSVPVALVILFGLRTEHLQRHGRIQLHAAKRNPRAHAGPGVHALRCDLERSAAAVAGDWSRACRCDWHPPGLLAGGSLLVVVGITGLALLGQYDFPRED